MLPPSATRTPGLAFGGELNMFSWEQTHDATIEELLEMISYMRFMLRLYNENHSRIKR
jgi:hypothetical protein